MVTVVSKSSISVYWCPDSLGVLDLGAHPVVSYSASLLFFCLDDLTINLFPSRHVAITFEMELRNFQYYVVSFNE